MSDARDAVRMEIRALVMDPVSNMPVVVLQQQGTQSLLPIWIGLCEANSIALQLEGVKTPRPMTHDLILSMIESAGMRLEHVHIHTLSENVYYARLQLRNREGASVEVDSRPSDAIAVALRAQAEVLVSPEVLVKAHAEDQPDEETLRTILEKLRPEDLGEYDM